MVFHAPFGNSAVSCKDFQRLRGHKARKHVNHCISVHRRLCVDVGYLNKKDSLYLNNQRLRNVYGGPQCDDSHSLSFLAP